MGSSEESGKDWSELEEEAAAADKNREDFVDDYTKKKSGVKDYKGKKLSSSDHRKGSSSDHRKGSSSDHRKGSSSDHRKGSSSDHRKGSSSMKNGSLKRSRDDRDGKHKKMKK